MNEEIKQADSLQEQKEILKSAMLPAPNRASYFPTLQGNAEHIIRHAIQQARAAKRPSELFAAPVRQAMRHLRDSSPATYADIRTEIKRLKNEGIDISLTALEKHHEIGTAVDAAPETTADKVVTLARQHCNLAHDMDRRAIAFIQSDGVRQVWYCSSHGFQEWLRGLYYRTFHRGLAQQAIDTAVATLEAIGIHDGNNVETFQRVGKIGKAYVIDMGDEDWSAIVIESSDWHLIKPAPIALTRGHNTRPLPDPVRGGNLQLLWKYANVKPAERPLVLAWLLESLRPETPYPVLELSGEQGAAKSTTQKVLRQLIDPSRVLLSGRPKTTEDIFVAGKNNYIVSYENLSGLTTEQQDTLCILSTGGGFAARKLFTNTEECSVELCRPVMVNGISACATRPDLIERTVHIELPPISADSRREQAELDAEWKRDYPAILGGLLDLAASTLTKLPVVHLTKRLRMADFQRLGEAMMQAMGRPAGTFTFLYMANLRDGVERALQTSSVAMALDQYLLGKPNGWSWQGTFGELHGLLLGACLHDRRNFPTSPKGLSEQIRRISPALRQKGMEVKVTERKRNGRQVTITLLQARENIENEPSQSSQLQNKCDGGDDGDDQFPTFSDGKEKITEEI
jgi:hypothetical protein